MSVANVSNVFKAYAAVLFLNNPVAGFVILIGTMFYPNIGVSGLLAAVTAYLITRLWQFPDYSSQIQIFNSMLVGLSIGAFYQVNLHVLGLVILSALLTTLFTTAFADWMWRLDRLPALSFPFVVIAGLMALVTRNYTDLNDYMGLAEASYQLVSPSVDMFFSALGAVYFTPTPLAGVLIFFVLLSFSRYLSMLAIVGYIVGSSILNFVLFEPHPGFIVWTSFNFILVAIALGGIFTIPGISSFLFAIAGVLLSVFLVIATKNLLLVEGLPVMAISFVSTTLIMLIAMKKRQGLIKPYLAPEPGLPEINYEKARLAKYRSGEVNSVPLLAPVFGAWTIYQGFNGKYTHKPPWQYALDFIIVNNDNSYRDAGKKVEDFYCFGAPVLSPAAGEIVRVYDRYADNKPGDVDVKNNWGNFILMRLDTGLHLLLAHLKQGSIKVEEKTRVKPGETLAACGNSGRSPQPHLHLQVQRMAELGSETYPFHLCSLLLYKHNASLEYQVISAPKEGDKIEATIPDEQLSRQLHLPVGREFFYKFSVSDSKKEVNRRLTVELTLLGQFRLRSDLQASAAFEESNGVLAFYDRAGAKDLLLDAWVLANGLTPLTESAHHWRDAPSASLLPLTMPQRIMLHILKPLGVGLNTHYERHWDERISAWIQTGVHKLNLGGMNYEAETVSVIDPELGCRDITLKYGDICWRAELSQTGLVEDFGIPKWNKQSQPNTYHEH